MTNLQKENSNHIPCQLPGVCLKLDCFFEFVLASECSQDSRKSQTHSEKADQFRKSRTNSDKKSDEVRNIRQIQTESQTTSKLIRQKKDKMREINSDKSRQMFGLSLSDVSVFCLFFFFAEVAFL